MTQMSDVVQNDRIYDIADVPFTQVPQQEKQQYATKAREVGYFRGYKLPKYYVSGSHSLATGANSRPMNSILTMESTTKLRTTLVRG